MVTVRNGRFDCETSATFSSIVSFGHVQPQVVKKASSSDSISWVTGSDRKSGRPEPEVQVTACFLAQRS
jgi:hypothetical protein